MKKIVNVKKILLLAAMATVAFSACKRATDDNSSTDSTGTGYASDYSKLERVNNDAESIADVAATTNSSNLRVAGVDYSPCATVTNDTSVSPHVLTINFGTANCTCLDGKNRRGEIIVYYTGRYKDSGSTHTITFNNYYVEDNQLTGSKTVTNMGMNDSGQYAYNINVNDTLNLGTDNGMISWTSTRTRTWIAGYGTPTRSDDVFRITGSATVVKPNGYTVGVSITSPLQVAPLCDWIEAGIVTITPQNGNVRTINYGTGDCDAEAQLTLNGHTYNVTLH